MYWYVDLQTDYVIKMLTLTTMGANGRNSFMDIFVAHEEPTGSTLDESNLVKCAHFPYNMYDTDTFGITCEYLIIGRYVIVKDGIKANMLLREVTVHGILYKDFYKK